MPLLDLMLRSLFRRKNLLRPYESALISSLESAISSRASSLLRMQLQNTTFVQRHVNDKEVNLYRTLTPSSDEEQLFPMPFPEWPMAVMYCSHPHSMSSTRATIWIAAGRLFSIVFSHSPRNWLDYDIPMISTQIIFDATAPNGRDALNSQYSKLQVSEISRLIQGQVKEGTILSPLDVKLFEHFLIPVGRSIPADYCDLLRRTNGFQVDGWRVNGLPLREIAMEGSNLFVLAETDGDVLLCAMDGDETGTTYLWKIEAGQGTSLGPSFINALNWAVLEVRASLDRHCD